MSLATMLWQTSSDNSSWTDMLTPSTFKIDMEDLDVDSYRSVMTGNLVRNVIARRWFKVGMSWNLLNATQVQTILSAVNTDTVYFKFKSPAFGTSNWVSFKGYVSKMSTELQQGQVGWTLSFNVVQSERGSFQ